MKSKQNILIKNGENEFTENKSSKLGKKKTSKVFLTLPWIQLKDKHTKRLRKQKKID